MTLLKDLITIPEAVHKGDYVMSPASRVADSQGTLGSYVVTPQLADAFKNALGFIFGGYVEHVRVIDPNVTLPGVYADEPLFAQAEAHRDLVGEDKFFATLNAGQTGGGVWGNLEAAAWDVSTRRHAALRSAMRSAGACAAQSSRG